ncbi:MAG: 2-C-methyl-D-erythritol 4-phosphate cytidylyltransferase [Bacteroidia bacterium]|nr:2-C-methyl-D-erythritol 4-phosphate cytidylyltransferase [Bacteroidia bacterium]
MNRYAIIVAGGKGQRMGTEVPKQFLTVAGKPVLMHTLERFYQADTTIQLILVLPEMHSVTWENLCEEFNFHVPHSVVNGGEQRYHSVLNGLSAIEETDALVAIHDGVRPLVTDTIINGAYAQAEQLGSAIVAVKPKDSLRVLHENGSKAVERNNYVLVQTPQVFRLQAIREAYAANYSPSFTDDASVFEVSGERVYLFDGDYRNIKITTPEDLLLAEVLLSGS